MSGSTIGGVVGGVIGFFVGGPAGAAWGWQIGSLVGAIVDPDVIEGPRLQESRTQTATDGVPLTYGYGTFRCAGNVTWVDEVKEHREEDDGKGGPVQVTYTYTLSYMVTVCKGPISGYKLIRRNGKIVYDARTDAELTALGYSSQEIAETRAAQAEFLQRATLYYGTNDQMPDPTMVAVLGAGNVPAYTGVAYIVMTDDETREGEYAQFEFVVANCGERTDDHSLPAQLLVTGTSAGIGLGPFAMAEAEEDATFELVPTSSGANLGGGVPGYYGGFWVVAGVGSLRYADVVSNVWQSAPTPWPSTDIESIVGGPAGWLALSTEFGTDGRYAKAGQAPTDMAQFTMTANGATVSTLSSIKFAGGYYYADWTGSASGTLMRTQSLGGTWEVVCTPATSTPDASDANSAIRLFADIVALGGDLYACAYKGPTNESNRWQVRRSRDYGATWPDILYSSDGSTPQPLQMVVCNGHIIVLCWGNTHCVTSADGFASAHATGISRNRQSTIFLETFGRQIECARERAYIIAGNNADDPSKGNRFVTTTDGITFSTPKPLPVSDARGIASSDGAQSGQWRPIPDAPGYFVDSVTGEIIGPGGAQIAPCQPTLGEIVATQCDKRGVTSRDVSELTDLVGGYRIAKPASPLANIQGLQPAYFFGASEFDGKLHFHKRGRDLTFALTYDDMVEREGDLIQWERVQERDLLRKATAAYTDPATNYADTTQQAERRSATVKAEGESVMELPITGDKDWAAQVADKSIKVAWGEPDECTFHVSIAHAELVTGAEGTVPYTDGTPTVVRIERIDDEGLVRMVHARKTRRHLYESNASGAAKPLPRFPGSNVRGPTDGLLMNLPVLLDQDDRPGIHWAASGMLSGWQGGQLQIRRAGQWTVAGTVYSSAGIGALLDPLPAHAGDVDTANVLRVRFNEPLESVTWVNLLQERNPFAILRDDGTAEIIQAQTATATAPNEYELTTLLRRRLATTTSDHPAGARIVLLDQRVQYATLEATDVGTTLEYRFVSIGTDPDAAPIQTIELTTMESQHEWPVADLSVEVDGDDYILTWLRRDRLGTDVLPIRSAKWAGYEVSYSHAGGSGSVTVLTESHTFTLPGASDITFSVAQLNQYTGAGPAQTVTIP